VPGVNEMDLRDVAGSLPAVHSTSRHDPSLMSQTLLRIVSSVDLGRLETLDFQARDGGYEGAELGTVGPVEVTAIRWPTGSTLSLRGQPDSPSLFRVVHGVIVQYRFDPTPPGYRFRRIPRVARTSSQLLLGGFHFLEALEPSLTVHAHVVSDDPGDSSVPPEELPKLRDAFHRDIAEIPGAIPPHLLAMLSGAR